jgi:hypothetical protein
MNNSNQIKKTGPVNPLFARMFGSNEVVVMNSLFRAGMRPAKDVDEKPTSPAAPINGHQN